MGLAKHSTVSYFLVCWVYSAFGFYLSSVGIRIDHVFSYVIATLTVLLFQSNIRFNRIVGRNVLLFFSFIFYALFLALINGKLGQVDVYTVGQFERYFSFLYTILMTGVLTHSLSTESANELLSKVCLAIVVACCLNSVLVIYSFFIGDITFLRPWHNEGPISGLTVADKALKMSRFTGIFATPFESGVIYTLGLLSLRHLDGQVHRLLKLSVRLLIYVGGLLAISKTFILGAIVFLFDRIAIRRMLLVPVGLILLLFSFSFLGDYWRGFRVINDYFNFTNSEDLLYKLSGGRFSGNSDLIGTMDKKVGYLLDALPFGYGFGNHGTVDNGYYEVMLLGGLPGLILYLSILFSLLFIGFINRRSSNGKSLMLLMLFILIGTMGAPMITKNRFSVLSGILIVLLLNSRKNVANR